MSSSSIPTLSDVLFYTAGDSYDYLTDNRPIQQLSDNIKTTAAALVGIGYGEHTSLSGALLAAGKAVELQTNGTIAYPTLTVKTGIYGLVIGSVSGGLNRVIWRSSLLDLDSFGLSSITGLATPGQVLKISVSTGVLTVISADSVSASDLILGTVLTSPYITVGPLATSTSNLSVSSKDNLLHNYGFTRRQNFNLFAALDATPIQFSKSLVRSPLSAQATTQRNINPLNITFNNSTGEVTIDTSSVTDTTAYGAPNWVLKESYTKFVANSEPDVAVVVVSGVTSTSTDNTWSSVAYPESFPSTNSDNFEVSDTSVALLQDFHISKYYQYPQAAGSVSTKPVVIVTVFDPFINGTGYGGESGRVIVCDFISYNLGGLETGKKRITLVGSAAQAFYNAFPDELKNI